MLLHGEARMDLPIKLRHLPGRVVTGAFILNSGLSKRRANDDTAAWLHGAATGTYPFLGKIPAPLFVKLLSTAEITLGVALLLPVVPTALAACGLTAFSAGLVGLYLRTPGMRQDGSLSPTPEGLVLAKDVWMLGIALGLVADVLTSDGRR
jgi:uncharacterized membrane protein YphA (DoxX/SURF4 family)